MREKVCGLLCILAFLFLLGTAGSSDLGYITLQEAMIRSAIGLAVFWVAGKYGEIIT